MVGLKDMAKKQKEKLVFLGIFAILSGMSIIGQGYLFVTIVDRIFLKDYSFREIIPLLLGLLAVLFARTLFQYLSGRTGIKMASKVKRDLRNSLLHKYSTNPVQTSIQGQSGQKVSVMMEVVDEVDSYFSSYIPQLFQASIIPLMILLVIFTEHVATGAIILITAPFIPIFMMVIGFKTKDKTEEQLDKMSAFSGKFLDTLQGLTTLKLFGQSTEQKEAIRKSSLGFREATMDVLKIAFQNSLALEFISMLSIGLVALEVAFRMIIFQDLSFYTGFLMLVLAPEFYTKLRDLGSAFHTGRGSMGAAKKLENELATSVKPVEWGEGSLNSTTPPTIELRGAVFSYGESDTFALKNMNVFIRPFEQVAIVGRTGSGKTTLLHVIAGLVPLTKGEVLINESTRNMYSVKDWFDRISYISQNPYLFSGTIAENIAVGGNTNATREDIVEAAQKAGISELVQSLPNGYDTPIGEAGRGLSGGEKQRIAIARAFLKSPSIILFDEPTTGLDLKTEHILQSSMKELSKKSTVITVAHRLHTIKNADQILFLENGEIIASGTHNELVQSNETYCNMVSVQQGGH
ncbi:thiol reductant ABC exporter subunit CydD [Bacilli bacterium]|nr:ABC transporter ATP-binding protein [Bacilli bacterium VT-13-104]PZD84058.1 thiol reductant ABC exporter subunit CydD [Bacilli bacterium]PZD84552.1 thiol reductant ABC exporter subunit CydD [Bacilli bacterium]PZD86053.1 thiol reductant ABC exporter subunit CydD [Bacilli bacterium]RCO04461.1 thiol reductant ABC exporter subunit CydD [Bacilli bacterium]